MSKTGSKTYQEAKHSADAPVGYLTALSFSKQEDPQFKNLDHCSVNLLKMCDMLNYLGWKLGISMFSTILSEANKLLS